MHTLQQQLLLSVCLSVLSLLSASAQKSWKCKETNLYQQYNKAKAVDKAFALKLRSMTKRSNVSPNSNRSADTSALVYEKLLPANICS